MRKRKKGGEESPPGDWGGDEKRRTHLIVYNEKLYRGARPGV